MVTGKGDRFRFSGLEMAVITASFVVTSVLVFVLGFYVGRDVAFRHLGPQPLTARVPVGPAEQEASESGREAAEPAVSPQSRVEVPAEPASAQAVYTVQVRATRSRKEAESLAAELRERGMDAFVVLAEDEGARWYRVRIGRFEEIAAAQAVAERCRQEFGLEQTYVTRQ